MVIDPEIIKGIRKVVFLKTEPQQDTDVLWAKGEGGVYEFYLFFDGQWHSCDDISNITISSFDGLISSFINDAEYLTKHQDISGKADKSSVYTKTETDNLLNNKADKSTVSSLQVLIPQQATAQNQLADKAYIATVLDDKQDVIEDLDSIRSGASAGARAYHKPSTGIPKADLSSAVQESLNKADTAIQSHQSLANYYTKSETDSKLGGKQDTINDLTDIRNGASKGATSLQPDSTIPASHVSGLATVATSGSYNDLSDKPNIPAAVAVKGNAESSYRTGNVNITPANIGLENVGNFKAVSTVASQELTDAEKSNARSNIGAGTSSFSGNYNDLSNKPTNVSAFTNDAGYVTADLTRYKDVYIGVAAVSTTVISSGYHHDNIVYGKPVTFSNASGYIWAVLPAEYGPTVAMSLVEVPMALDSTTTIDSKSYKIWKSMNQYSGTFKLYLF